MLTQLTEWTRSRINVRMLIAAAVLFLVTATDPVAAASKSDNIVCNTFLKDLFNQIIQACIWLVGPGVVSIYIGTNSVETFAGPLLGKKQKKMLKTVRGHAIRKGLLVFAIGPAYGVIETVFPAPSCVTYVPFG